eukprot:scaffold22805_cov59-Phaeocystis_antarctica.AAC.17
MALRTMAPLTGSTHYGRAYYSRYLAGVMLRVEHLGEERVMPLLKQGELVPMVVAHLHQHSAALKLDGCGAGSHFLALTMDTEDFSTYRSTMLPAHSKAQLQGFKPLFLAALTTEMEGRRKLRPLLDEVTKAGG